MKRMEVKQTEREREQETHAQAEAQTETEAAQQGAFSRAKANVEC